MLHVNPVSRSGSTQTARIAPHPDAGGYWISRELVDPLERVELADLLAAHADARIELRVVPNLWQLWTRVIASTLEFGGVRLRNAERPPPTAG